MGNSLQDVQRAWCLAMLGLTESSLSTTDLLYQIYAGLVGVGGGGGSGTITSVNGDPGPVVVIDASEITDAGTKVIMLATERTKLTGIATGATANSTDAQLRDRTTHTGVQTAATISDFTEAAQDAIAALLTSGTQVALSYNDVGNTLQISATGADAETMRDTIGAAIVGTGLISVVVNDGADTITVQENGITAALALKSDATHTHAIGDLTGQLDITRMAPNSTYMHRKSAGVWPNRPTARTDITVIWLGDTTPTVGGTGMLAGTDVLWLTA